MTVWVSDDENHVPLRVDSPILVGSIKVDLVGGYDNLQQSLFIHDQSVKIKSLLMK